jgi:ABC-type bacteriocin/lantibiotic exporter with double-glycine peptidase domain
VAVGVAVSTAVGRRQFRHQVRIYEASEQINSRTYQIISGVAKVSTAAAESRAFAHWAEIFAAGRRHTFAARTGQNRLTAFNSAFTLLAAAAAFFVVGRVADGISQATFLVFNVALFQILASLLQVSSTAMLTMQVIPSLRALTPILQAVPEVASSQTDPGQLLGNIRIDGVTFAYSDAGLPAVEDATFSVSAGEFVAIVGPSGCGKSTLLRLLLAFETPDAGSVVYDGQNLADLDPVAVRRQCGVVLQDATLFAGDILSNIIGSGLYTYEDAWEALKMCGMDADVGQMPMGMYTMLSDGGGTLSGGQRQRLLIARAMVARPRILFLDEATSALDNRSQEIVTESMRLLNATRVVIAHRLSTIRGADRIVVLDGGRVVQEGTYDELLEVEGMFRTLALRQLL